MSYSYDESSWVGPLYTVSGEGTAQAPIDFHIMFENLQGLKTGLYQVPQNYGTGADEDNPYELCENNASEWTSAGDVGSPADEAVDYKYGSYAIKCTKTGTGDFQMRWNENRTYRHWLSSSVDSFNLNAARIIKFSIKPSSSITLTRIGINAGTSYISTYLHYHTNDGDEWTLNAGVWNDFEIDITEFDTPGIRFLGGLIHQIDFEFSGGSSSDTIIIDGLTFERDDCDIKKYTPTMYECCFHVLVDNCYFAHDTEATVIFNFGSGRYGASYALEVNNCDQFDIGDENDKFPVVIIYDIITTAANLFFPEANGCDINILNTYFISKNWQYDKGQTTSPAGKIHIGGSQPYGIKYENCVISIGTFNVSDLVELKNCDIINKGYVINGADPTIDGVRIFFKPSNYVWSDYGTLRALEFLGWLDDGGQVIFFQRLLWSTDPITLTIIDCESDGVKENAQIIQNKLWHDEEERTTDQILRWGYTMNVTVKGTEGVLVGATVKLYDKDDNLLFEETTDENGEIPEQEVITRENNFDDPPGGTSGSLQLYPWKAENSNFETIYHPFTLIIEKDGYQQYRDEFFELWEPYDQVTALQKPIYYKQLIEAEVSKTEVSGLVSQSQVKGTVTVETKVEGELVEKEVTGSVEEIKITGTKNN